jgi:hypothetical protein
MRLAGRVGIVTGAGGAGGIAAFGVDPLDLRPPSAR